jgi:MoaA/NifB/PqqE/SkfB family radical SAM enzyme
MAALRRAEHAGSELPSEEFLKNMQVLDADTEKTITLIDQLLKMGTGNFLFTGSGEPFLHKGAMEFIERVKHAGCACTAETNGTLLDREKIDQLVSIGCDELRITTMAGSGDVYVITHPGTTAGTFDSLRENLLYLAERKTALGVKNPKVTLTFVVLAQNCESLFDFAEFSSIVNADSVLYRPVDDIGDPSLSQVLPAESQAPLVREQLHEVKDFLSSENISHNIDYFRKVFNRQIDTAGLYKIIPCYYGWLASIIDMDGLIYPCCRCYEPLGNAYHEGFNEVWNGEAYRLFREKSSKLNVIRKPVSRCDCYSCVHYMANIRAYKMLHPIKGRSLLSQNGHA